MGVCQTVGVKATQCAPALKTAWMPLTYVNTYHMFMLLVCGGARVVDNRMHASVHGIGTTVGRVASAVASATAKANVDAECCVYRCVHQAQQRKEREQHPVLHAGPIHSGFSA